MQTLLEAATLFSKPASSFFSFCPLYKDQDLPWLPGPDRLQPPVLYSLTQGSLETQSHHGSPVSCQNWDFSPLITQTTSEPIRGGPARGPHPAGPSEGTGMQQQALLSSPLLSALSAHGLWLLPSDKGRHGDLSGYEMDFHV